MKDDMVPEGFKMTEIGVIPEGWEIRELINVATLQRGKDLPKREWIPGPFPIIGSSGIIGYHKEYICDGPGVVTGRSGSIGRLTYTDARYWPHNTGLYVKDFHGNMPRFVYYLLNLVDFRRYATGVSVPTLNRNFIHSIMLPCPPLPEQKKIAAVLSSVQDSKEKTEAAIEATRALKKSLMKYLFTYGAVSPEEAEDVPLKETEIGMIPEEWEVAKLGDVVTRKITDGTHKTPSYTSSGIPFITATNLTDGRIDFGSCKYISQDEHLALIRRCKPEKGDILLSKVGTLGSTAMVDSDIDFSIFVQVALIKPMHRSIDSGYLKYSLTSSPMQRQIHQKSSQSTMKYIGVGKIAQLAIPLPPLPTQQHIADILSAVDHRIEAEENKRKALEALFKTLLNDLMTGSLRVNELEIQS